MSANPTDLGATTVHDEGAERAVLGIMMLNTDASSEVRRRLDIDDFYKPLHQMIYTAACKLDDQRLPVEPTAILSEMTHAGNVRDNADTAIYLTDLYAAAPSAASLPHYASLVRDAATRRGLAIVGIKMQQMAALDGVQNTTSIVEQMRSTLDDLAVDRLGSELPTSDEVIAMTLEEIDALASGKTVAGIPTGFTELDNALNGLRGGQMIIIAARPGVGKALALDTPIATPTGWTTMGEIREGDYVMGRDGLPTQVIAATEVMTNRPCFEVEFSDGTVIVADAEHLWRTESLAQRRTRQTRKQRRSRLTESDKAALEQIAAHSDPSETLTAQEALALPGVREGQLFRDVLAATPVVSRVPMKLRKKATVFPAAAAWSALSVATTPGGTTTGAHTVTLATMQEVTGLSRKTVTGALTRAGVHGSPGLTEPVPTKRLVAAYPKSLLLRALISASERTPAEDSSVLTTQEIAQTLITSGKTNHAVRVTAPLNLPQKELPIAPYVLGAWLADGTTSNAGFTTADLERLNFIREDGYLVTKTGKNPYAYRIKLENLPEPTDRAKTCLVCGTRFITWVNARKYCSTACSTLGRTGQRNHTTSPSEPARCSRCDAPFTGFAGGKCRDCRHVSFQGQLRNAGVLNNKHIPNEYLRASASQRASLLAGLLDTDGTGNRAGKIEYVSTNRRLANDVFELVISLGYRATMRTKTVQGRTPESSVAYSVGFTTSNEVMRLTRKRKAHGKTPAISDERRNLRYITRVSPIDSVPVRCIEVANDDRMFLAGRTMIPTHNSSLMMDIVRHAAFKQRKSVLVFSLEMSKTEVMMRALSGESYIDLHSLKTGDLDDHKWQQLSQATSRMSGAKLGIDDNAAITMTDIRAKARAFQRVHGLDLIAIDYLQLMGSDGRSDSRQQEVSEISRGVKLLAKEFNVPVLALSQLNRGSESRSDKKPVISDLRESGSLEQDSDVVILLHREEMYEKESPRAGEADVIIAKQRSGPTGTVVLSWLGKYSRFDNRTI
jgi:replicative DNA helicase